MKKLIYVVLVAFLAVSCKQAEQKAETEAEAEVLQETADQEKGLLGFKWNKCKTMEKIMDSIRNNQLRHSHQDIEKLDVTNQAHMHRGSTALKQDIIYFNYNGKIRGGNVTFYSKNDHLDRDKIGYFPFVVLDESLDILDKIPGIHLKIDTAQLFRIPAMKNNGNVKKDRDYCMFIVTGFDIPRSQE